MPIRPQIHEPPAMVFPPPQTVPDWAWQLQNSRAWRERMGRPAPKGLLDTVPYERLPLNQGLLQPVIWDRVRRGLLQTEGAPRGGSVPSIPLRGRGREFDWSYSDNSGSFSTTTPKGQWMYMRPTHSRGYEVIFDQKVPSAAKPSMKSGIERFSDVLKATNDFVKRFKPAEIEFSGEGKKHEMLYEKLAPQLAEMLGGKLVKPHKNRWLIKLGEEK